MSKVRSSVVATAITSLIAVAAVGCGSNSDSGTAGQSTGSEKDPKIPQVSIKIAQAPFNDHSYSSIGVAKGWFKDVGITIEPAPQGKIMTMDQVAPALIAGQIDVGTMFAPIWANTLDQTADNKVFTYADLFLGFTLLGRPDAGFKTVKDFRDQGMDFDDAAKAAVLQLKGKSVAYPSEAGPKAFRDFAFKTAGLRYDDIDGKVLDDVKIVELATSNRIDVASPTGGPQIVRLLADGWVPIVTARDYYENGSAEALETVIGSSGLAARGEWLEKNHDTALRMASVMYRIIDFKRQHRDEAAAVQIPFLNKIAGTDFTVKEAQYLDEVIDPFYTFEEQAQFFKDTNSPLYYKKNIDAVIGQSRESGVLKKDHDADEYLLADDTWKELKKYKDQSEGLIAELTPKATSGEASKLLDQAKAQHDARNYLDAARFARAAELALQG